MSNESWSLEEYRKHLSGKGDIAPAKAKRTHWEDIDHVDLVKWFDYQYPAYSQIFFHLANGGLLAGGAKEGGRRKALGVRAGASDMCLAIARGGYHGLFIELKATPPNNAPVQANQLEFLELVRGEGYRGEVCLGWNAARLVIEEYLSL